MDDKFLETVISRPVEHG